MVEITSALMSMFQAVFQIFEMGKILSYYGVAKKNIVYVFYFGNHCCLQLVPTGVLLWPSSKQSYHVHTNDRSSATSKHIKITKSTHVNPQSLPIQVISNIPRGTRLSDIRNLSRQIPTMTYNPIRLTEKVV